MSGRVHVERDGAVGWLVIDHPERRNAVSVTMWRDLAAGAAALRDDPDVRVAVLRGAGDEAFAAGADISEFETARTGGGVAGYDRATGEAILALYAIGKPLLAMVHGWCLGGGMTIALTADLRYASPDARFAIPAARLGVGYPAEGIERVVALVGPAATKELFFTARRIDAATALRLGLLNDVVPKAELEGHVREVADTIAANAPLTVRSVKFVVDELARPVEQRDLAAMHATVQACFDSDDYREGTAAFLEKRAPRFTGR